MKEKTSCTPLGQNNNVLPLWISLSFPSSVNISSINIVKSVTGLLLNNSNVFLSLWEECMDDFRSESDVTGVAISHQFWGEWKNSFYLNIYFDSLTYYPCENQCFSGNKHFLVYVIKLWEEVWIFAVNKTIKLLTHC